MTSARFFALARLIARSKPAVTLCSARSMILRLSARASSQDYGVESVLGTLIKLARLSDVPFGEGLHRAWHLNLELTIAGLLSADIGSRLWSCITRPGDDFGSGLGRC